MTEIAALAAKSPTADRAGAAAASRDPTGLAIAALETMGGGWRGASSTGRADVTKGALGFTATPLGAAAGVERDDDPGSTVIGMAFSDPRQRAQAVGFSRLASLIGSVSDTSPQKSALGGTVFLAEGSLGGFGDNGQGVGARGTAMANAIAPSSSSTAAITIAGVGNLARMRGGGATYMADGKPIEAMTLARGETTPSVLLSDNATQPATLGLRFNPRQAAEARDGSTRPGLTDAQATRPADAAATQVSDRAGASELGAGGTRLSDRTAPIKARTGDVPASFSENVTATGRTARTASAASDLSAELPAPVSTVRVQTSQSRPGEARPAELRPADLRLSDMPASFTEAITASGIVGRTASVGGPSLTDLVRPTGALRAERATGASDRRVDASVTYKQLLEFTRTMEISRRETGADGTQVYLSASVSADPTSNVVRFLASVVGTPSGQPVGRSVEAFRVVAPDGERGIRISTVEAPLATKVMASAGPLDNTLALP